MGGGGGRRAALLLASCCLRRGARDRAVGSHGRVWTRVGDGPAEDRARTSTPAFLPPRAVGEPGDLGPGWWPLAFKLPHGARTKPARGRGCLLTVPALRVLQTPGGCLFEHLYDSTFPSSPCCDLILQEKSLGSGEDNAASCSPPTHTSGQDGQATLSISEPRSLMTANPPLLSRAHAPTFRSLPHPSFPLIPCPLPFISYRWTYPNCCVILNKPRNKLWVRTLKLNLNHESL